MLWEQKYVNFVQGMFTLVYFYINFKFKEFWDMVYYAKINNLMSSNFKYSLFEQAELSLT